MKIRIFPGHISAIPIVASVVALSALSGLGASPTYPSVVKGDGALGYYRFNDSLTRTLINVNSGSLGPAGDATNDLATLTGGVVHSIPGAIVGSGNRAAFYDFTTRTEIPFNSALNTANTEPFSVEAWIYAVNDQVGNGMGVLVNRLKPSDGTFRSGWVMYQRALDTNHCTTCGPGLGWDFQMYDDLSGSTRLQVQSSNSITLGKWQHVVIVYDPVQVTNATLTIFIDGVQANQSTWNGGVSGTAPGYGPVTGTNDIVRSPHGQPAISLGGYNNANPDEPYGFANPWMGGIDEFAWYNTKLSPARILAHYQNGTNAARSTPYDTVVKSDNPVEYLRLDEVAPGPDFVANLGDQRSAGNATNSAPVKHPGTSALAGRTEDGSKSGRPQGYGAVGPAFADIPWTAKNNPDAGTAFTLEGWFRPVGDQTAPGPSPINNRLAGSVTDRTGWVIYQRNPNSTYSSGAGETAVGWAMRMYQGTGGNSSDVISSGPYTMGEWQHVVFTWDPTPANGGVDNGTTPSGSEEWIGTVIVYTNGVAAATNATAGYAANISPTADLRDPADFAIGSYNLASGLGEEFDGDIDEVAFYNGYILTPEQVLSHYQAGTNAHPETSYESLVFNAAGDYYVANSGTPIPERTTVPQTYLRFNGPAYFPAANSGSLGYLADGSLVLTTNNAAGPITAGFENPNPAVPVYSSNSWVSLNNPSGLNVSGQVTLEAWIKPDAIQGATARIISHGPFRPSHYDANTLGFTLSGSQLSSNEVFLRIEGSGATYSVGTSDGVTTSSATASVTAGDLGGVNGWIHLAGTYDGTNWRLFRNGAQIAIAAGTGALAVPGAEWAIGATGLGYADFFSGGIDEAAIYGTALSPATIKAHYYVGQNGPVSLSIARGAGTTVMVTWPAGTLQESTSVGGTYTDVLVTGVPAISPYNPTTGTTKFYRVKL